MTAINRISTLSDFSTGAPCTVCNSPIRRWRPGRQLTTVRKAAAAWRCAPCLPGSGAEVNQTLELAGRVADFLDLGELMCLDALERRESCGGHFREEWQTDEGEALRDDENFCHVAAWEFTGAGKTPKRHVEQLNFENVHLATRSYK